MLLGAFLVLNFFLIWSVPLIVQGLLFHNTFVGSICRFIYAMLERNTSSFFGIVYRNKKHEEYGITAFLVLLSTICNFSLYIHGRISTFVYILGWVGIGGRCMGGAYTFAHKEAHNPLLYKYRVNIFENWLGVFYGNVPNNFSTSHIYIHHALDGAKGDTFYMWDLPRNSPSAFLVYAERVFCHMCGLSPLLYFTKHDMPRQRRKLMHGLFIYWVIFPLILLQFKSVMLLFVVWLQPLFAMSVFLALINWAQHGFIELDAKGTHDPLVNATTIVDGRDDYFAENYHWEHHYTHDQPVDPCSTSRPATVFRNISIPELAVLMILDKFEHLTNHTDIDAELLRRRAATTEFLHVDGTNSDQHGLDSKKSS